ncbi:unnamed protein product [Durusdinium trenchii]|uniref:Uncharacterized protein n=1 Tax=Durusdinium trenchii TaxID=1381693 RepID=A0ABP0K911_9DINO
MRAANGYVSRIECTGWQTLITRFSSVGNGQALVLQGVRTGPRRAKKLKAVENRAARLHYREKVKQVVFAAKANQRSQETSLRFHLFRTEQRLSEAEKLRGKKTLHPFGKLERLKLVHVLDLVEGPAQAHAGNRYLWGQLEKLFFVNAKVLSMGELARVLHAFGLRHLEKRSPPPMRLLHLVIFPVRIEQILFDATLTSRLPAAFKRFKAALLRSLPQ